ncbi:MAG: desaturase, partial [Curvibacter sp.]
QEAKPLRLPQPMLTLRGGPMAPAQFVFDRGQPGGPAGQLAFVLSASPDLSREALTERVLAQGRQALAPLGLDRLQALGTVIEKRATFACTPGLQRPAQRLITGLSACGDYVEGPYPATLEGAVLSAQAVVAALD